MADKREIDEHSGAETTGHEWDGVKELDTPLPRWWLWIFYATIIWSIGYMILYPAWPAPPGMQGYTPGVLGHSDRVNVAAEMANLEAERAEGYARLVGATYADIESDPVLFRFALAAGRSAFGDNCATCHGVGAQGFRGYPNLNDDVWLWGGTFDDITQTIRYGIRSSHSGARFSQMPAFGRDQLLSRDEIRDLTQYVLDLSGREADQDAVVRAAPVYQAQCAACHGVEGRGDRSQGAPDLTIDNWLYGGSRDEIYNSIWRGPYGVMPHFDGRMDDGMIAALAVYVFALGGGEDSPPRDETPPAEG
ncbi:MAG: cytochrome-c oxidase, cbb3-type subunit III [Maricaulaceae bacterium]|nr:cytochrome-c oxidase, cbb3-type subunit III [Maricaulaceae bacterium]